jgi:hypothetical protein
MPKAIITESINDGFLSSEGKQRVVTPGADGFKLKFGDLSEFEVEFVSSNHNGTGMFWRETSVIKLKTLQEANSLQSQLQLAIQPNYSYSDHYSEFNLCDHISTVQSLNLNKSIASYDVYTQFNYLSSEYDEFTEAVDETNITSVYSNQPVQVRDFINSSNFTIGNSSGENSNTPTLIVKVPNSPPPADRLNKFPYYNKLVMTNKTNSSFSNFLDKMGIADLFLGSYLESPKSPIGFNVQEGAAVYQDLKVDVFDLSMLARQIRTAGTDFLNPDLDSFFISDFEGSSNTSHLVTNARQQMFYGFIKEFGKTSSERFRTFEQIYNQETCYFEDYAYSVEKFNNRTGAGSPKQTFYAICKADGLTSIEDTQIKYGNTYTYKCKTHYVIVGNKYFYGDWTIVPATTQEREHALVTVYNRPQIFIVPIHTFTESIVTIQPPPLPPQIKFLTQNNSSKKIDIYLSPMKGSLFDSFQTILAKDEAQRGLMNMNKRNSSGIAADLYRFDTMSESGFYEIFKMNDPPRSIEDFANFKLAEIRMPWISNSAIYRDRVKPNTKYYYLFRKINSKELVSNPTSIFQVELLIDADDSKVIVEEYEIPMLPTSRPNHKFQSLFQISPAAPHIYFDPNQPILYNRTGLSNTLSALSLGIAEKSIWGRKFKFRVKSTTSGKIIDYNVTFTLTKDKTEEDF